MSYATPKPPTSWELFQEKRIKVMKVLKRKIVIIPLLFIVTYFGARLWYVPYEIGQLKEEQYKLCSIKRSSDRGMRYVNDLGALLILEERIDAYQKRLTRLFLLRDFLLATNTRDLAASSNDTPLVERSVLWLHNWAAIERKMKTNEDFTECELRGKKILFPTKDEENNFYADLK